MFFFFFFLLRRVSFSLYDVSLFVVIVSEVVYFSLWKGVTLDVCSFIDSIGLLRFVFVSLIFSFLSVLVCVNIFFRVLCIGCFNWSLSFMGLFFLVWVLVSYFSFWLGLLVVVFLFVFVWFSTCSLLL